MALGIVVVEVVPRLAAAGTDDDGRDDVLVLRFGDGEVDAPIALASPGSEAVEGVDYHVVRRGETLSSIAALRYGDARHAGTLANLNGLSDPNAIEIGQILQLK